MPTKIVYERLAVITNREEFEWFTVEYCLREVASLAWQAKKAKHGRRKLALAIKREKAKLVAEKKRVAQAKYALFRSRR
jgi:hypothetical protein